MKYAYVLNNNCTEYYHVEQWNFFINTIFFLSLFNVKFVIVKEFYVWKIYLQGAEDIKKELSIQTR